MSKKLLSKQSLSNNDNSKTLSQKSKGNFTFKILDFSTKKSKIKFFSILSIVIILVVALTIIFTYPSNPKQMQFDAVVKNAPTYKISATLDDSKNTLITTQTTEIKNTFGQDLTTLKFNLYANAYRENAKISPIGTSHKQAAYYLENLENTAAAKPKNTASYGKISFQSISILDGDKKTPLPIENHNNPSASYQIEGDDENILTINLENSLKQNATIKFEFLYIVSLPKINHRLGISEKGFINLASFYPSLCLFENGNFFTAPYYDKGDPFTSQLSNFDVSIKTNATSNLTAIGSGDMQTSTDAAFKTFTFKVNAIADFALTLSKNYKILTTKARDITINYAYTTDTDPQKSLQVAVDSLTTFSNLIGSYPYKTLNIAQSQMYMGGMEYGTFVTISDEMQTHEDTINVIIHEILHQWFYNLVRNNQVTNAFLDEGLTEFITAYFYKLHPEYGVDYNKLMDAITKSYLTFKETFVSINGTLDESLNRSLDKFETEPEYSFLVYAKTALMFNAIFDNMGKTDFESGLKNYFNNNIYKVATVDSLITSFIQNLDDTKKAETTEIFNSYINGNVVL